MICFPNAKINIGLHITERREDGFHNIQTIFVPIPLTDALEFAESDEFSFNCDGLAIEGSSENNLVVKAYQLLKSKFDLPPIKIHLLKNIPMGAGLGGGSADGAFMLKMLNAHFNLQLSDEKLEKYAATLGSDCPFFIRNKPVFAHGRGELMEEVDLNLSSFYILLVKPPLHVPTKEAYASVVPQKPRMSLKALIDFPVDQWKTNIRNQFEKTIFPNHPEIEEVKEKMYSLGAKYAAMSGSGSSVFGLFRSNPQRFFQQFPDNYYKFSTNLSENF